MKIYWSKKYKDYAFELNGTVFLRGLDIWYSFYGIRKDLKLIATIKD